MLRITAQQIGGRGLLGPHLPQQKIKKCNFLDLIFKMHEATLSETKISQHLVVRHSLPEKVEYDIGIMLLRTDRLVKDFLLGRLCSKGTVDGKVTS